PLTSGRRERATQEKNHPKSMLKLLMAFTKENAREFGKRGGRPKGRLNTGKLLLRELAAMIVTDGEVQQTLLHQARAGTINPSVLIALMYTHGGRPQSTVEIRKIDDAQTSGLTLEQQRELVRALPPAASSNISSQQRSSDWK